MRRVLVLTAATALLAASAHANPSDIGMTSATKNEVIVVSGAAATSKTSRRT